MNERKKRINEKKCRQGMDVKWLNVRENKQVKESAGKRNRDKKIIRYMEGRNKYTCDKQKVKQVEREAEKGDRKKGIS